MISNIVKPSSKRTVSPGSKGILTELLNVELLPVIGFCTVFFMAAFNLINFELTDEKVSLDWQLMIKLGMVALAGGYGVYGFLLDARVRRVLLSPPAIWLFALSCVYIAAGLFSISKVVSIVSAGCVLCGVLATATFCVQQGRVKTIQLLYLAIGLFVVGSWLMYLMFPAYGVFSEPLPGGAFLERMGGLSHPNTLGQFCAMSLILSAVSLRRGIVNKKLVWAMIVLAGLALVLSVSRTSMAAAMMGLIFVFRDKIWDRRIMVTGLTLVTIGVTGLLVASTVFNMEDRINRKVMGLLTKSSDSGVDELSTATGRSVIWGKAISLIQERPLTGWGAGTSKELLIDYSSYTHNMFLNIWLSSGVFGGAFVTLLMLLMLYKVLASPAMVPDSLIMFFVVNGLFENVIFANVVSAPTLVLVLAVIWRVVPPIDSNEQGVEYDSVRS